MKRTREPGATREALLIAAADLFAKNGFDGTRVEQIARAAQANKAMISYHFGGKKQLYLAILNEAFASVAEPLRAIRESGRPADERLRAFVEAFHEMVQRRPSFPVMMVREAISGGRYLDQRILPHFRNTFALVREIIEQGCREGTFRPVDPILTHVGLMGSLVFFFSTEPFRHRLLSGKTSRPVAVRPEEFVRHTQELFTRGLAAGAGTKNRPRSRS